MARYTDIDLLIDKVEETTWYHINKNGELVKGTNSETDIPLYKHSDIARVLADAPTADVVPKSEVEEIIATFEVWLYKHYNGEITEWGFYKLFAELKKKYTEGTNGNIV